MQHSRILKQFSFEPEAISKFVHYGRIFKANNYMIEAKGLTAQIGSICLLELPNQESAFAEVVGFTGEVTYLMSYKPLSGLSPNTKITQLNEFIKKPYGPGLLGRVLDPYGVPLDTLGAMTNVDLQLEYKKNISPLRKRRITEPLDMGVRLINSLLTIGQGQRVGLMAGSGVGKSVLMGMMAKNADVDITVVALVGERSREVKEFIDDNINQKLNNMVMVVAPADTSPLNRIQAAEYASSIAEYFRDQGKKVLLLMDSVTRYAQAIRELGLSLGEPPTTKGYPPSVFTRIPQLIERVGNSDSATGGITAIYTVLAEGDDIHDPVVDCARSILDGHFVLSRRLAEQGQFPAIDIEQSVSRVMNHIVDESHQNAAREFKKALHRYNDQKDFISMGTYQKGQDLEFDVILEKIPKMLSHVKQGVNEKSHYAQDIQQLQQLMSHK